MFYSNYIIYLFELFQVEGEIGCLSVEIISSELLFDDFVIELKRLEILLRGWDDEMFFSLDIGSFVFLMSDEVLIIM